MKPMPLLRTMIKALNGAEFIAWDMRAVPDYNGRLANMLKRKEIKVVDRRAVRTDRKVEIFQATALLKQPDWEDLSQTPNAIRLRAKRESAIAKAEKMARPVQIDVDELPGLQNAYPDLFKVYAIPAGLARRPMPWVVG